MGNVQPGGGTGGVAVEDYPSLCIRKLVGGRVDIGVKVERIADRIGVGGKL